MKILFVDTDCPRPYDISDLQGAIGGTEGSVLRVAHGLSHSAQVAVAQHNREEPVTVHGVEYRAYRHGDSGGTEADVVVVLRNYKILPDIRRQHPHARLFLWMHCFPGSRWNQAAAILESTGCTVVSVSDRLSDQMRKVLGPCISYHRVYNPVQISQFPSELERNPDQMIFCSSPHKGLAEVLVLFAWVRKQLPQMKLLVADPGYWRGPVPKVGEGVEILGKLDPHRLHQHVASSLCVFYPQTSFAETFGLVFAEANALGTPVLAHSLGAAREVLDQGGEAQVIDCSRPDQILKTLLQWRSAGPPIVSSSPAFDPEEICQQWLHLLSGSFATLTP